MTNDTLLMIVLDLVMIICLFVDTDNDSTVRKKKEHKMKKETVNEEIEYADGLIRDLLKMMPSFYFEAMPDKKDVDDPELYSEDLHELYDELQEAWDLMTDVYFRHNKNEDELR